MNRKNHLGFTLIELLITIAVISIIAAMAVPSFQEQIARMKMKDDLHKVEMCFKESQTTALTYRVPVTVRLNNGSPGVLECGARVGVNATRVDLNSSVQLGSGIDVTTTFGPDRLVYSNYDARNLISDANLDNNNAGYQFCISGYPQQILTISSRGLVQIREGSICN